MNLRHVLIFCSSFLTIFAISDEEEWATFKRSYERSYTTEEEENHRFEIFKDNLKKIRENNEQYQKKESYYKLGINKFADVSEEEFNSFLKSSFDPDSLPKTSNRIGEVRDIEPDCIDTDEPVPDEIDWREQGAVTPVKDERTFYSGYSWAFAVAGAIEAQVYFAIGTLLGLSAQQLIDCADPTTNKTYWGGKLDFAYEYVSEHGIHTEDEYPYSGSVGNCQDEEDGIHFGYQVDMYEECQIKEAVGQDGPVTVLMDASKLANYERGIIDSSMCSNAEEDLNHSVLIVGYGMEPNVGYYWLIKNSWGIDWGEEGYLRISRMNNNTCGVGHSPSYPYMFRDDDKRRMGKKNGKVYVKTS